MTRWIHVCFICVASLSAPMASAPLASLDFCPAADGGIYVRATGRSAVVTADPTSVDRVLAATAAEAEAYARLAYLLGPTELVHEGPRVELRVKALLENCRTTFRAQPTDGVAQATVECLIPARRVPLVLANLERMISELLSSDHGEGTSR